MRGEFPERPTREGIFGPEILINATSGIGCLRLDNGTLIGPAPEPPSTNAFVIWLGRPIVVVSEGVQIGNVSRVAAGLRQIIGDTNVPVVVSLGRVAGRAHAIVDGAVSHVERELARAEAYALVQAGWVEAEKIPLELNGQSFDFQFAFRPGEEGTFIPDLK